jgi:hypothetical protein
MAENSIPILLVEESGKGSVATAYHELFNEKFAEFCAGGNLPEPFQNSTVSFRDFAKEPNPPDITRKVVIICSDVSPHVFSTMDIPSYSEFHERKANEEGCVFLTTRYEAIVMVISFDRIVKPGACEAIATALKNFFTK